MVPYLRAHGVNALDTLIISHADSDHSGGAPAVLDAIEVRQMVAALAPANALWTNARQRGADTWPCAARSAVAVGWRRVRDALARPWAAARQTERALLRAAREHVATGGCV